MGQRRLPKPIIFLISSHFSPKLSRRTKRPKSLKYPRKLRNLYQSSTKSLIVKVTNLCQRLSSS